MLTLEMYFSTISSGTLVLRLTPIITMKLTIRPHRNAEMPSGGLTKKVKTTTTSRPDTVPAQAPSLDARGQYRPRIVAGMIIPKKGDDSL